VGQGNREETGKTNRDDINGMERERDSWLCNFYYYK
jgi:hypothetical protein